MRLSILIALLALGCGKTGQSVAFDQTPVPVPIVQPGATPVPLNTYNLVLSGDSNTYLVIMDCDYPVQGNWISDTNSIPAGVSVNYQCTGLTNHLTQITMGANIPGRPPLVASLFKNGVLLETISMPQGSAGYTFGNW